MAFHMGDMNIFAECDSGLTLLFLQALVHIFLDLKTLVLAVSSVMNLFSMCSMMYIEKCFL